MSATSARRERKQFEVERNFVRMPHALPDRRQGGSSIVLPAFHGITFRIIGKKRRAVYHQLDGSIELATACACRVIFGAGGLSVTRVERVGGCPIDEHRIAAQRLMAFGED
jgi:hypothetical protein